MNVRDGFLWRVPTRAASDLLLFGVTAAELIVLVLLTPSFTVVDWIYVCQHLWVLGIALTRRPPARKIVPRPHLSRSLSPASIPMPK